MIKSENFLFNVKVLRGHKIKSQSKNSLTLTRVGNSNLKQFSFKTKITMSTHQSKQHGTQQHAHHCQWCHTYPVKESVPTFFGGVVGQKKGKGGNFYTAPNFCCCRCCCLLHFETIFKREVDREEKVEDNFSAGQLLADRFSRFYIYMITVFFRKMRVNDHN